MTYFEEALSVVLEGFAVLAVVAVVLAVCIEAFKGGGPFVSLALTALVGIQPGQVFAVTGAPGTGKTRIVQKARESWRRSVVFDVYAARDRLNFERGDRRRYPWPGEVVYASTLFEHPELLDADPLDLVVQPDRIDARNAGAAFAGVAELAWHTGGDVVLIAEEAGIYSRNATDLVNRVSSGGAHAGVSVVFLVQSFGRLHKDARRCCSHLVCGAAGEESDFKSLRERSRPFAERVRRLRVGDPQALWKVGDV